MPMFPGNFDFSLLQHSLASLVYSTIIFLDTALFLSSVSMPMTLDSMPLYRREYRARYFAAFTFQIVIALASSSSVAIAANIISSG